MSLLFFPRRWPVDADGAEVEDGGGAQHDVHGHQVVADGGAQGPHAILELTQKAEYAQNINTLRHFKEMLNKTH